MTFVGVCLIDGAAASASPSSNYRPLTNKFEQAVLQQDNLI